MTSAAAHDSRPFEGLLDPNNTASKVWADTAYRCVRNEAAMAKRGRLSMVHLPQTQGPPAARPPCRSQRRTIESARAVEQVFAGQKHRVKLFVRTISIARAKVKIGMANFACNCTRLAWLEARATSA